MHQLQVTSISQFGDVKPSDWAYQALSNLIERYGCVAGYPDGSFRGGRAMTRYEAAALLNACLDRVTEVTDELKRLMAEFEKELALLKGRVDGLEARVGELEANAFSTTTKLKGLASFVLGANAYQGSATSFVDESRAMQGATAFNYDVRLNLDTSFNGTDLLRTQLRAGNFADSPWFGDGPVGLNALEVAFQEECGTGVDCGDVVAINRLFYQVPLGAGFTATVGGVVRQDDMLALWPSVYPAETILDIFNYAGAPGAYSSTLGAGGGLWWKLGGFSISANYVAANGDVGEPKKGGIATSGSAQTATIQLGYAGENHGLAAAYTYSNGTGLYGGSGTPYAEAAFLAADAVDSFSLSGYWQPARSGWLPSISAGWGINTTRQGAVGSGNLCACTITYDYDGVISQSWFVGLQWADALLLGNTFGMAVGQPTFVTKAGADDAEPFDGNFAWEWWYKIQVTDNISVTPAIFYLSAPLGQEQKGGGETFSNFGGLVRTSFRF